MRRHLVWGAVGAVVSAGLLVPAAAAPASAGSSGSIRTITPSGTSSPQTGAFTPSGTGDQTQGEFPGQETEPNGPGPYQGTITDRSLSGGTGHGASVASGKKAKSHPEFVNGFEGLNLYQQRYARGGNQFTVEPPDQALCAGGGYVLEATNDVLNVFSSNGTSLLPDNTATNVVGGFPRDVNHAVDLNSFFGYPAAIDRSTGTYGPSITDPSCLYDAATKRWFVTVLTLESTPGGDLTEVNHLDTAVSKTSDPTGAWTIYQLDVTNDGSNPSPDNACPCIGDYPHIGADANGFYITTNAYPWEGPGFDGAQIYAFSKAQLAASAAHINVVHLDTFGAVNAPSDAGATQPGFTVWPAQSPGAKQFATANGGTEYFLSSNAADEATHPVAGTGGDYVSKQVVSWTLANTASLNTASPSLRLTNKVVPVGTYAIPPKQQQPGSGTPPGVDVPQGHCINDTTTLTVAGTGCWRLLLNGQPAHDEVVSRPDSNDTRMQQVSYANGKLWGALDTALSPGGTAQRAGIAYYVLNPSSSKVMKQGYLGAAGHDFTYPAIGVTASGRGVIGFTATGDTLNPSAAYAPIDALAGAGAWSVVPGGTGAAPDDGFTSYKALVGNPPRTRWGDYGAAAVDGGSVWIASEYVAHACDYTAWGGPYFAGGSGDNLLGTCAGSPQGVGVRTALGNWSTRVSRLTP